MKIRTKQKNSGFTLVETLVAIAIFVVSVLAMLISLGGGIKNVNYVKQKIIATYLAQEGIEYFRNVRDNHVLFDDLNDGQVGWDNFTAQMLANQCNDLTLGCGFDDQIFPQSDPNAVFSCASGCELNLLNGKYVVPTYGGDDSNFRRSVVVLVNTGPSGDMMQVTSTVTWLQGSGPNSVTFSENIFNWY